LVEAIQNKRAVAASDALMNRSSLAIYWIVTKNTNRREVSGGIQTNKWKEGMILAGKELGVLSLIKDINKKTKNISGGEVIVNTDNKFLIKECCREVNKVSDCTNKAGAIVEVIRHEMKKSTVDILLEYSSDKSRPNTEFHQAPGAYLMKRCDTESKRKCEEVRQYQLEPSVLNYGIITPV